MSSGIRVGTEVKSAKKIMKYYSKCIINILKETEKHRDSAVTLAALSTFKENIDFSVSEVEISNCSFNLSEAP